MQTKKKELKRNACGSTFLEISANEVRKIKCRVPKITEQNKISQLLSLIDQRIATQNKIIQQLHLEIQRIKIQRIKIQKIKIQRIKIQRIKIQRLLILMQQLLISVKLQIGQRLVM